MARAKRRRQSKRTRGALLRWPRWWPAKRMRRRWLDALAAAPGGVLLSLAVVVTAVGWFAVNWGYQVAHKPSELLFPVSETLYKDPAGT